MMYKCVFCGSIFFRQEYHTAGRKPIYCADCKKIAKKIRQDKDKMSAERLAYYRTKYQTEEDLNIAGSYVADVVSRLLIGI